ncbi:hypothetical protein DFH09DRAFT_1079699 [Mycena vulgaris]|nr:hypothetical protein DFH09DRAFT_1079699 [Mycena vulgaris]
MSTRPGARSGTGLPRFRWPGGAGNDALTGRRSKVAGWSSLARRPTIESEYWRIAPPAGRRYVVSGDERGAVGRFAGPSKPWPECFCGSPHRVEQDSGEEREVLVVGARETNCLFVHGLTSEAIKKPWRRALQVSFRILVADLASVALPTSDLGSGTRRLAPAPTGLFGLGLGFGCRSKPKPGRSACKPVCRLGKPVCSLSRETGLVTLSIHFQTTGLAHSV